jgi:glucokinase
LNTQALKGLPMNSVSSPGYPFLVGDIGGTNARFGLVQAQGERPSLIREMKCADFSNIHWALRAYLQQFPTIAVRNACIGIANPVRGDQVRMTNFDWAFSVEEVRAAFGFERLLVVNDFKALATAVPALREEEYRKIGGGHAVKGAPIALIGAGTGLGMAGLVPSGYGYISLEGEGGHATLPAMGGDEMEVVSRLQKVYCHVSAERVLSGPGIEQLYQTIAQIDGTTVPPRTAADITKAALQGEDPLARRTLDMFCGILGGVAANLAVTLGALGGVFIAGGIVPKLGGYFVHSPFRKRFETKGRFSSYMADIPTYVIEAPYAALHGASMLLNSAL